VCVCGPALPAQPHTSSSSHPPHAPSPPQTVVTFRRLGDPGFVDPDALGLVSAGTRIRRKDLEGLEAEPRMLEADGLPTADGRAGAWPRDAAAAQALSERESKAGIKASGAGARTGR